MLIIFNRTLLTIFALLVGLCTYAALDKSEPARDSSQILTSKIKSIASDYVAVQFWSPFCAPCADEVQELNKALESVNKDHLIKKLFVLGIPVQSRQKEIKAFIEHFQPKYEQWILEASVTEKLFKNSTVPLTILFFGKERVKVKEWHGKINSVELIREIERFDQNKKEEVK